MFAGPFAGLRLEGRNGKRKGEDGKNLNDGWSYEAVFRRVGTQYPDGGAVRGKGQQVERTLLRHLLVIRRMRSQIPKSGEQAFQKIDHAVCSLRSVSVWSESKARAGMPVFPGRKRHRAVSRTSLCAALNVHALH